MAIIWLNWIFFSFGTLESVSIDSNSIYLRERQKETYLFMFSTGLFSHGRIADADSVNQKGFLWLSRHRTLAHFQVWRFVLPGSRLLWLRAVNIYLWELLTKGNKVIEGNLNGEVICLQLLLGRVILSLIKLYMNFNLALLTTENIPAPSALLYKSSLTLLLVLTSVFSSTS